MPSTTDKGSGQLLQRILVPLDGSQQAENALSLLSLLPRRPDAELLLLNVVPLINFSGGGAPPAFVDDLHQEARGYLSKVVGRPELKDASIRPETRIGSIADTILETAEREKASLIAMTSHGRSGLSRWILGSVAEKVIRAAHVPVLLARSYFLSEEGRMVPAPLKVKALERILIPMDGSEHSRKILASAMELAGVVKAKVSLLYVEEPGATGEEGMPELAHTPFADVTPTEWLRAEAAAFIKAGIQATVRVAKGNPAEAILEACRKQSIDLIAMATHGRRGPSRLLLGSVTEKVLRLANVPMLIRR